MKKIARLFSVLLIFSVAAFMAVPGSAFAEAKISSDTYKAGDTVTVEGTITPGQDLYVLVSSQTDFAPKDTNGPHETKRLAKDGKKAGFDKETRIPVFSYMLTNNPEKFGKVADKRFGGPSFMPGIYKTTMFKLGAFDKLDAEAKSM